ncbi:Polysialic acid transport protein KpsM [compost metagenome]
MLFSGLIVFNIFSECINRAPGLLLSNVNYVKKVVFPLEILPWVTVGASLFHALISIVVWLVAYIAFFGLPHLCILLLPLVLLPFVLMVMGISWFLAALGVYLRDVTQVIGVVTTALMFISPIFYPATALPEEYQKYLFINPLTITIEQTRNVLYWAKSPDYSILAVYSLVSTMVAWCGFAWFQKTRKGFADVL